MSLTSKINGKNKADKEFQEIIRKINPEKKEFYTNSGVSPFSSKEYIIKVSSELTPSDSSASGIAFDYLARFIIANKLEKNYISACENIVAQKSLNLLKKYTDESLFNKIISRYKLGIELIQNFISNKKCSSYNNELIEICCFLARLEQIYRSGGMLPIDIEGSLIKSEKKEIINDLYNMSNVFNEIFIKSKIITEKSIVIFNPKFGLCSYLCNGADADIFVDGVLYDFKTTKKVGYNWREIGQIISYYLFNVISQTLNSPIFKSDLEDYKIEKIALYKARYGEIEFFDIKDLNENIQTDTIVALTKHFDI